MDMLLFHRGTLLKDSYQQTPCEDTVHPLVNYYHQEVPCKINYEILKAEWLMGMTAVVNKLCVKCL